MKLIQTHGSASTGESSVAAIYIRISSEEQKNGWSVDAQLRECKRLAEQRNYAFQPEFVFVDEGFTGTNTKRPAFRAMIQAALDRRFSAIIVHKLDRFSRSVIDILHYIRMLAGIGVPLVCADAQFDPSTPNGMMMLTILAAFAEWYVQNLAQETTKGKYERFVQGYHNGRLPHGYAMPDKLDASERDPKYAGNRSIPQKTTELAGIVLAFEMYATGGYSDEDIAQELNRRGYRSAGQVNRRGKPIYTKETVWAMLQNPYYVGLVTYTGQKEKGKTRHNKHRQFNKGVHEAAISQELFDRCQRVRASKRHKGNSFHRHIHPHLFGRQLASCRSCGEPLRTENHFSNENLHYLRCASVMRGIPCKASQKRIAAFHPARQIADLIGSLTLPKDWRDKVAEMLNHDGELEAVNKAIDALKAQIRRLNIQFDQETITDVEFKTRVTECKAQLAQLSEARPDERVLIDAGELLEAMPLVWRGATDLERQDLLRRLVSRIIIDVDEQCAVELHPHPTYLPLFQSIPGIKEIAPGRFEVPDIEREERPDRRRTRRSD